MTPFELNAALEGMVCLVDTREQDTPLLRARIKQIGFPHEREKLNFGDYSAKFPLPNGQWLSLADRVAIERKMSMDEICQCFCQGRGRFQREFERAKECGAKIYLLVENGSFEQIYQGKYRSKMNPKSLMASVLAWAARYRTQIIMCTPKITGWLIRDILYREGKEILEHMEV